MTLVELARRLKELTATAPEHIDARAHLGSVLRECEQLQEAAAEYERAFAIGSVALPTDFDGRIEWIRLDNRPFRAAYGLALVRPGHTGQFSLSPDRTGIMLKGKGNEPINAGNALVRCEVSDAPVQVQTELLSDRVWIGW